ncbi:MAG TPA: cache domain-containing protein [Pyrinomonadaceae bacterium]|nr:cache domain-containing protein [Pyrinomonadaceae bacterium]
MAKFIHRWRFQRGGIQKRLQIMAVTVIVLAMGIAIYFTSYISRQADYFTNRNFRELAGYSQQIPSRIINVKDAFRNAVIKTVKAKSHVKEKESDEVTTIQCLKERENEQQLEASSDGPDTAEKRFSWSLQLLGETKFTGIEVKPETSGNKSLIAYQTTAEQNADLQNLDVAIDVAVENGEPWLKLLSHNLNQTWEFSGKVNFNDLIQPMLGERKLETSKGGEHEEGFDDVIIARADDGTVIYDRGTPELSITSLRDIPFFESPQKRLDFNALTTTTSSADVHLGGEDYKVYLQPVIMPLSRISSNAQPGSVSPTSQWVVGGLVKSSHFRHETWRISYTVIVFLTFLCALVALSWPLLKLVFIGPKDRLRLADVYLISLSLLVGSALLTLFLLWSYTYASQQGELDEGLRDKEKYLAGDISERFERELDEALAELDRLDAELKEEMRQNSHEGEGAIAARLPACHSRTSILDPPSGAEKAHVVGGTPTVTPRSISRDDYPYFNAVVWMSAGGQQEVLWTIGPAFANLHNVADRPYFKEIMNGHFLTSQKGKQFFLQSIASRATGSKTALISKVSDVSFRHSKGVIGMDTNLWSVMDPVLPDGFGYRIIDDDNGMVLFQSAESKDWEENFYLECDNNPALRALVSGRLSGDLDINYAGKAHHLYVKPLASFPKWSLVVFRDKQPLRALYLEIVTIAGFLFLGYVSILFVVFFSVYVARVNSWERLRWIWPGATFSTLYGEFMVVNIIWGLLLIAEILLLDGLWLVLTVFLTSLLGIANLIFRPSFKAIRNLVVHLKLPQKLDYSHAYTLNMVLVLIIAGMLPATAFFKVTYNKGMALFTRQRQMSLWKAEAERYNKINSKYSTTRERSSPSPFQDKTQANDFITKRLKTNDDIYESFLLHTSHENNGYGQAKKFCAKLTAGSVVAPGVPPGLAGISGWVEMQRAAIRVKLDKLVRQFPLFSGFVDSDIFAKNHAADCSWVGNSSAHSYSLIVPDAWKGEMPSDWKGKELSITTELRKFQQPPAMPTLSFILGVIGFLSIPVGLLFLSRFTVGRIFLLHLDKRALNPIPQNAFATTNQNLFVIVGSPLIDRDSPPCNGDFHRINLKLELHNEGWVESLKSQLGSGTSAKKIVIDYFDYQINDLKKSLQKLELLQWLLAKGKIVVIMSNADPSAYSAPEVAKKGKQKQELLLEEFADRWANIVSRFIRVYLVETGDVKSFQEALSTEEECLRAHSQSDLQRQRIGALIKFVRDEGSPRGCLQKICLEIIKLPGFEGMSLADVFKQIAAQARLYYQRIWATCSEAEKLTLLHLAEDRFLSRNDPQLGVLMLKGLIVKGPDLRLMNQTFKHFVLTQCSQTGLVSIEDQAKRNSPWHMLRIPLLIGFVGVILFLVLTQKDFYSSSLTTITGLVTGIPALFKLLSVLQSDGPGQKLLQGASHLTK